MGPLCPCPNSKKPMKKFRHDGILVHLSDPARKLSLYCANHKQPRYVLPPGAD
ncbi:unnamed protein product [Staurois parvus]|uniref:Uncharacterized protein n=1 Tax=Staurois parvus TaxID=386267 RepID=A0ABN9DJE0_9NEOB|nr:unnamed protein product [Staurois parvus]